MIAYTFLTYLRQNLRGFLRDNFFELLGYLQNEWEQWRISVVWSLHQSTCWRHCLSGHP